MHLAVRSDGPVPKSHHFAKSLNFEWFRISVASVRRGKEQERLCQINHRKAWVGEIPHFCDRVAKCNNPFGEHDEKRSRRLRLLLQY